MLSLTQKPEFWIVSRGDVLVAQIGVDRDRQVSWVKLDERITADDRLSVLQLAVSHAMQYLRRRPGVAQANLGKFTRPADLPKVDMPSDSTTVMSFGLVPETVEQSTEEEVRKGLAGWGVEVIDGVMIEGPGKEIQTIIADLPGVTVSTRAFNKQLAQCALAIAGKDALFTCWGESTRSFAAHPESNGKRALISVDGVTSRVTGEHVVLKINPSFTGKLVPWLKCDSLSAAGKNINIIVSVPRVRTKKGKDEFRAFVLALIGRGDAYIAVQKLGFDRR